MSGFYPGFGKWFNRKVTPGLLDGTRSIIVAQGNDGIRGLAVLKDTDIEQKLCCLRVRQDLQGSGLGIKLFNRSFEVLQNDNPLLSVSEDNYGAFEKIFEHFGFEFVKAYDELYLPRKRELSFNGLLLPEPEMIIPNSSMSEPFKALDYSI